MDFSLPSAHLSEAIHFISSEDRGFSEEPVRNGRPEQNLCTFSRDDCFLKPCLLSPPPCCVTVHCWMCSAPSRLCFPLTKHSTWLPALCRGSVGYWNINWSAINGTDHRCGLTFLLWQDLIEHAREAKVANVPYMIEKCSSGEEGGQNANTQLQHQRAFSCSLITLTAHRLFYINGRIWKRIMHRTYF